MLCFQMCTSEQSKKYVVYSSRWLMLALFCFVNLANSMMWITFAPISDLTVDYIGSPLGNITDVNMLATVFSIFYLPGTLFGAYCNKKLGVKHTLVIGGTITTLGAFIRVIAALCHPQLNSTGIYSLLLWGQILGAFVQPLFVNASPLIASLWFGVDQRDIATTIGSMANPIGNAIGQIIPAALVSRNTHTTNSNNSNNSIQGMDVLLGIEVIICFVSTVLVVLFFREQPPTPPSASAELRRERENTMNEVNMQTNAEKWYLLKMDIQELFRNKYFVILFCAFSLGLGSFNSLLTLIFQFIQPYGYSNDDAGYCGAVLIVAGLIGAGIAGYLLNNYKAYAVMMKTYAGICAMMVILMVCVLYPDNLYAVLVGFALVGFFLLPLLPIAMESSAEITYPITEDVSVGILLVGGNILTVAFTYILQELILLEPFGHAPAAPASLFLAGILILTFLIILFFQVHSQRSIHELKQTLTTSTPAVSTNQYDLSKA